MKLRLLKNTVLFFVIITVSCAKSQSQKPAKKEELMEVTDIDLIIPAANSTDLYLRLLEGKSVGVVGNQTSIISKHIPDQSINPNKDNFNEQTINDQYTHLVDSLLSLDINIIKVYSPEHGFRGMADAGELVKDGLDTKTSLPIVSLYGKNKKPTKEQLTDVEIMIFDIQDVGVRFYTYLSTLHYVMEACAENGIPLIVLDRPNPNGNIIDGPIMEAQHFNFLGLHPVPLAYGMTIGEYAQMINGEGWLANGVKTELKVISLKNYSHNGQYSLPVRPSPNLPNDTAIRLYPSLGLFEGTNINAGRGTEFQFQRYGAPFLDSTYYSLKYIPKENFGSKFPKHKDELCYGKDLTKLEHKKEMTLKWLLDAYSHSIDKSKFFNTSNFTAHAGTEKLQQQIESGMSEDQIKDSWTSDLNAFNDIRKKYLIYD